MAARIVVYEADDGWRWRLLGANNEIVLPPEGHRDASDATRALTTAAALLHEALELGAIEYRSKDEDNSE